MATTATQTSEKAKSGNLKAWLAARPYWEKFLWRLHLEKDVLDAADLDACYRYLLEDSGVSKKRPGRTPIEFNELDFYEADASGVRITLEKVVNLKHVNAIDEGCVLEFGRNLTVIYGDNGAGKSGVGRLLSNACLSRKPRKLLSNARKTGNARSTPSADFHIVNGNQQRTISYKLGQVHTPLKAFAVFDQESALIHLNSENKVDFVPSKIRTFDEVFQSVSSIEERLQKDIDSKELEDPTDGLFADESPITRFLDTLSGTTTDKEIDDALQFTPADKTALAQKKVEVARKLKQDTSAQKKLIQDECRDLEAFKSALATKTNVLTASRASQINAVLKEIREKKDIVEKLSAKSFEFAAFKNVGSAEWKALILAAQKLHEKETLSAGGMEPAYCVLCRQTLTAKEKTLFGNYWEFLKSTAEAELRRARQTLSSHVELLQEADRTWPSFSQTEVAVKVLKRDALSDLEKLRTSFAGMNERLGQWIGLLRKEQDVAYTDIDTDLRPISTLVSKKRSAAEKLADPTADITKLNREIATLEQKQQAARLIPKIKRYVAWLKWSEAVDGINLSAVRGATTRKKTEIMGEIVISRYVDIFNTETERLDCNFGLKVESHGRDANTIKELKLDFARSQNPSDILSEGEQTVSALADFLTEAQLDKNNSGIIFDDPVTSLDHDRRSTIAKRLVDEAKARQVVVLTHDIVFLLDLQHHAEREAVDCTSTSMRKSGQTIGLVKPELPWIALDVRKKAGYLRNELPVLKKAEIGDPDHYRNQVKLWYMLLRESWERAVEERLFKGVVQRFNKAVQTERLRRIEVTDALVKEVTEGMTESSQWLHDMAAGVNPAVPTNTKLAKELDKLDAFIKKVGA